MPASQRKGLIACDRAAPIFLDQRLHEPFELPNKFRTRSLDRAGAERWVRIILNDKLGEFGGFLSERLLSDQKGGLESSDTGTRGVEVAIDHCALASGHHFSSAKLAQGSAAR